MRQPFGAPAGGVSAAGATTPDDDDFEAAGPVQAWFTQLVKASQGIKPGTSSAGPRKPAVPPKPKITPRAKTKLKFTPEVSTQELAKELPFSGSFGQEPWDTPTERAEPISIAVKRDIRKKAAEKKATDSAKKEVKKLAKKVWDWKTLKTP